MPYANPKDAICDHGKPRPYCKPCGGCAICPHEIVKYSCRTCSPENFCDHGRRKIKCDECRGVSNTVKMVDVARFRSRIRYRVQQRTRYVDVDGDVQCTPELDGERWIAVYQLFEVLTNTKTRSNSATEALTRVGMQTGGSELRERTAAGAWKHTTAIRVSDIPAFAEALGITVVEGDLKPVFENRYDGAVAVARPSTRKAARATETASEPEVELAPDPELAADGYTDFGGVSLRSASGGRWICVIDIGVKLDGLRSDNVLRTYGCRDALKNGGIRIGTYKDTRNRTKRTVYVRIDHLEAFVANHVRNKSISEPIKERMAALSRRFVVGDSRLHDAIDANATVTAIAIETAPESGLAAMSRLNDEQTVEEDARADTLLASETTAAIMGASETDARIKDNTITVKQLLDMAPCREDISTISDTRADGITREWLYVLHFDGVIDMSTSVAGDPHRDRIIACNADAPRGIVKFGITKDPRTRMQTHLSNFRVYTNPRLLAMRDVSGVAKNVEDSLRNDLRARGSLPPAVNANVFVKRSGGTWTCTESVVLSDDLNADEVVALADEHIAQIGLPIHDTATVNPRSPRLSSKVYIERHRIDAKMALLRDVVAMLPDDKKLEFARVLLTSVV